MHGHDGVQFPSHGHQDDGSCTYCTCDEDALSGYTLTVRRILL